MRLEKFMRHIEDILNYTRRLLAKIKCLQMQFKLLETKISMILYQLLTLMIGTYLVFDNWNNPKIYLLCSIIIFMSIIIISIPFTSMIIFEFLPEYKLNLKKYNPKIVDGNFIIEESSNRRTTNFETSNYSPAEILLGDKNKKQIEKIKYSTLNKSFNKLILDLQECEIFDLKTKKFNLKNHKVTRLQSMQILCLFFEYNYETESSSEKKNRQKIFDLFNNYFDSPEMNQKNWNDYSTYINFDDELKNIDPVMKHDYKNYFYHHLTKTKVKF